MPLGHIQENSSKHSSVLLPRTGNVQLYSPESWTQLAYIPTYLPLSPTGAQFGLGAEIGISTQKLHARGPMGLEEITSYKWVIEGDGQTRRN